MQVECLDRQVALQAWIVRQCASSGSVMGVPGVVTPAAVKGRVDRCVVSHAVLVATGVPLAAGARSSAQVRRRRRRGPRLPALAQGVGRPRGAIRARPRGRSRSALYLYARPAGEPSNRILVLVKAAAVCGRPRKGEAADPRPTPRCGHVQGHLRPPTGPATVSNSRCSGSAPSRARARDNEEMLGGRHRRPAAVHPRAGVGPAVPADLPALRGAGPGRGTAA